MKNLMKFKNFLLAAFVLFAHAVIAQTISGTVSSEDGPLPGATIIVKGTNNGTRTDFDGNFSIEAGSSDVLVVSFVGFSSQEVSVGDNDQITVNLQADNELEEVVITGYGSQKEKEITSAVTKITADEFNKGPINTTAGLLEGKVAGLSIYSKGCNPNAGSTIRLRGITSFGDNTSPLFVIDGVPGSSIDNVDPNDIETINVLKDGSAAAIYGSRGSSGVIIVTTKKGSQGRVKLSYNGQYGVSEKMNQIKIMTPAEFRAFGGADLGGNVANFADEVTRQAASSIHNISAAGGFDNTTFRVSANLRDVNTKKLLFDPYIVLERGDLSFGVIGVTSLLPDTSTVVFADEFIKAGNNYIDMLSDKTDIIIMLVNTDRQSQKDLAKNFENADFIVTSGSTNLTRTNAPQNENGPYMFSCGKQGKYLQTIEVKINDANSHFVNISDHEKKINNVKKRFDRLQKKDPKKKLEEIYKDQSNVLKLIDQYRIDLKSSEEAIAQAKNTIVYQTLGLNKKITDDPEMLSFVNQSLSMCKALKPQVKEPKKTKVDHSGHNH